MDRVRRRIQYDCWKRENLRGSEIGIAILDSGMYVHEDLKGKIACFKNFIGGRDTVSDENGHGTHIAGIIAGNGKMSGGRYQGIAPDSHLIICKVLDQKGNGNTKEVLQALEFCIENQSRYNIRLINISIGTIPKAGRGERTDLIRGVEAAWDAGIVVVVAAGNNGPAPMSVTTPGISRKVITVGTSEEEGASGRGPTPFCIVKPEIVAPGTAVRSCANRAGAYCSKSGSSMSTAVTTGCLALLLEKYPEMTNKEVKLRLYHRAVDLGLAKNRQGWGGISLQTLL